MAYGYRRGAIRLKVLIVDDRRENLFSMESLLADLNVSVLTAESGREALSLMVDHEFAVAILDVQMPEMNGFELAQLMRGAERTKTVPIIFVTAGVHTSVNEFKGYESGAVDFLPKPLHPEILKAKVKIFLELAEQREKLSQKVEELYRARQEADAAKEAAEQANRLKSSFLANMSHEIRTPLGALMGFAELLKEDLPLEERNRYVDVILRNGNSLVQIIGEILDLSKIEAGHIDIDLQKIDSRGLLSEVGDLLKPLAEKKNLKLEIHVSENLPRTLGTDPLRFKQILTNLLGNAIKFTEKGRVEMFVEYVGEENRVKCRIEDTGIGISEELTERLFQPFSQGDVSITRSFGGTGLGLSLSKKLAELLGGSVRLESSTPSQGSIFEVSIKDFTDQLRETEAPAAGAQVAPLDREDFEDLKVLLVDDSADNQLFVRMLLSSKGAEVDVASNGREGLSKALEGDYDVVLMDLQMPVVDGLQATRALREKGFSRPILALTANAMKEERDRCLRMGFNDYVSKPVDKKVLFSAISHSLS